MPTKLFINLPVKDITKTREFFTSLGFTYEYQFTDNKALCLIINDDSYIMLLEESYFQTLSKKKLADSKKTAEVIISISAPTRNRVNEMVDKAIAMGGAEARNPDGIGFVYGRSFKDLDGHIWEVLWMGTNT
jgi:predicted lactoylglutathione lyase